MERAEGRDLDFKLDLQIDPAANLDISDDMLILADNEDLNSFFGLDNVFESKSPRATQSNDQDQNQNKNLNSSDDNPDNPARHQGFNLQDGVSFGQHTQVTSVARDLNLEAAIVKHDTDGYIAIEEQNRVENTSPSIDITPIIIPIIPESTTPPLTATPDFFELRLIGDKIFIEQSKLISVPDELPSWFGEFEISPNNAAQLWKVGNIKDAYNGEVSVLGFIPGSEQDFGILDIDFETPVYEFGFDVFNLAYGPNLDNSEIIFYDRQGQSTIVPFGALVDPRSPFYQPSIVLGADSANRIQAISAQDLMLSNISSITIQLPADVGISHMNGVYREIELKYNELTGNLVDNDVLSSGSVSVASIQFNGTATTITNFGSPITTPLGGKLVIDHQGVFTYTPPKNIESAGKIEKFHYTLTSSTGEHSSSTVEIKLIDNLPQANDNDQYIQYGYGLHQYNLVLVLDISGSMEAEVYHHSRLEMAQDALMQLIVHYDHIADNLNINIVPFSSGDGLGGAFSYHAQDYMDALAFIMHDFNHSEDGIAIEMMNPDTGLAMGRGTHYDSALYHTRILLEQDLVDPNFAHYEPIVYFITDGTPNLGHTATDDTLWPDEWGTWQHFIKHTKHDVPGAQADQIVVYTISIDPDENMTDALVPIASDQQHILETDTHLFAFSQDLLNTLPERITGNLLDNDLFVSDHARLQSISYTDHNHELIKLDLPENGMFVKFTTQYDGMMIVDSTGDYIYIPGKLEQFDNVILDDIIGYTLYDDILDRTSSANLNIHVQPNDYVVNRLIGGHGDDVLSSNNKYGIVYMEGGRGEDSFIIDFDNKHVPMVYIKDLTNGDNTLSIINTHGLSISDIFSDFHQDHENANVSVYLNNADPAHRFEGTHLIFENIGTVPGGSPYDLMQYFNHMGFHIEFV